MFSPTCIARVRPLSFEEKSAQSSIHPQHRNASKADPRRRSGSTFSGRQLGCVRQQADTVLALVSDEVVHTSRGDALEKQEYQLDACYVPEIIDYRRARRPSMFGAREGQDPAEAQQVLMFKEVMLPLLRTAIKDGLLATVVVHGGPETGKSYTVFGTRSAPGLLYQSVSTLLARGTGALVRLEVSILECFDETVRDLLNPQSIDRRLKVRQTKHRGFAVDGAQRARVEHAYDLLQLVDDANTLRSIGSDRPSARARMGHTIVQLFVWVSTPSQSGTGSSSYSEITFVDTAASCRSALMVGPNPDITSEVVPVSQLPSELLSLLHTSALTKGTRTLAECWRQLAAQGQDYDEVAVGQLPVMDSVLTMLLHHALIGRHQTVIVGCIAPSVSHRGISTQTLERTAALRYVRYPAMPRPVDPSIRYTQMLAEELSTVKQAIKTLEAKKSIKGGETKSVLLQKLVELTEELQDVTMSDDDRDVKHRIQQQQRQRALAKHKANGAVPVDADLPRLLLLPTPPAFLVPGTSVVLPQSLAYLPDGATVLGTAQSCSIVVTNPARPEQPASVAPAPSILQELDAIFDVPPPAEGAADPPLPPWSNVGLFHCIFGVSQLELDIHLSMPLDDDLDGTPAAVGAGVASVDDDGENTRKVYVNGEVMRTGFPNRRLHHLDRIVVGPWSFQLLLPARWRQRPDERDALLRKKKERRDRVKAAVAMHEPRMVAALYSPEWQSALGVASDKEAAALRDTNAFSRNVKGPEHGQLVEAYDRCDVELRRFDDLVDLFEGNVKAAAQHVAGDIKQVLTRRAALGMVLAQEYPAGDASLDDAGRPVLGVDGFDLSPRIAYTGQFAFLEVARGGCLDEDDTPAEATHAFDVNAGNTSTSMPLSPGVGGTAGELAAPTADGRPTTPPSAPGGGDEDDMFAELDALILKQTDATSAGRHTPPTAGAEMRSEGAAPAMTTAAPTVDVQKRRAMSVVRRRSIIVAPPDPSSSDADSDDWAPPPPSDAGAGANSPVESGGAAAARSEVPKRDELGGFTPVEMDVLRPLLTQEQPADAANALQKALSLELAQFREEVVRSRMWQPEGPPSIFPADQAMYQATVRLNVKRGDIPVASIGISGEIYKLRIRRSLFHRGGFYEVDAIVSGRFLIYYAAAAGGGGRGSAPSAKKGNLDQPCLGACFLYGAKLELMSVGDMPYCILIVSVAPRKPTKDKGHDTAANRVVLGFPTRPLQLEWFDKLRMAVLPEVPARWAQYFGSGAARYLMLDDEAGLFAPPAEHTTLEDAHRVVAHHEDDSVALQCVDALTSLSIGQRMVHGPLAPQLRAMCINSASARDDVSAAVAARHGVPMHHSPVVCGNAAAALVAIKTLPAPDDLILREEATKLVLMDPMDVRDTTCGQPTRTPAAANPTSSNFLRGGSDPPAALGPRDPACVVPLRQIHNATYLKHYFKTIPVLLLGTATSADISEEFDLLDDLTQGRLVDGNMSAVERELLFTGAASSWKASSASTRIAPLEQPHFLLVDHFQGTLEIVHPTTRKAAVFYGREILYASASYRDPTLVVLTLFHVKPYLYGERFPSYGDRQRFLDSVELLRPTKRLYAPWLLPLHKRSEASRGGLVQCNTIIDGVGNEAVVVPRGGGAAAESPGSPSRAGTLKLEGEIRVAVTSNCADRATMWVGSWNLSGVPLHSDEAIFQWASLHVPQAAPSQSFEDILVFSLQLVGGFALPASSSSSPAMAGNDGSSGASSHSAVGVPPAVALAEKICSVLQRRDPHRHAYRVVKAVHHELCGDALIVIAKDYVVPQLSVVQSQILTPGAASLQSGDRAAAVALGSALVIAFCVGRSTCCCVGMRLPCTSVGIPSATATEMAEFRQALVAEYLSQIRLGDAQVDVGVFFDLCVVCGDFGESAAQCGLGKGLVAATHKAHDCGGERGARGMDGDSDGGPPLLARRALGSFEEVEANFPPTCPVIIGKSCVPSSSVTASGTAVFAAVPKKRAPAQQPPAPVRELSYSGRVLFRSSMCPVSTARPKQASTSSRPRGFEPLYLGSIGGAARCTSTPTALANPTTVIHDDAELQHAAATELQASQVNRQSAMERALLITEALPVSLVGAWTYLRNAPLSFFPEGSTLTKTIASGTSLQLRVQSIVATFPCRALHPSRMSHPRVYITARHGLSAPVLVACPANVSTVEVNGDVSTTYQFGGGPSKDGASPCGVVSLRTASEPMLLANAVLLVSVVWGLSGAQASLGGSAQFPWCLLSSRAGAQTPGTACDVTQAMERGGRVIGEVTLRYKLVTVAE